MKNLTTEVLVIGSGFGASPMALRLAEAGLKVTMIEKGPAIDPYRDFKHTQKPDYLRNFIKTLHGKGANFNYAEAEGGGSGFYEMMSFRGPSDVFSQLRSDGRRYWPIGVSRETLNPYYDKAEKMINVHQIPADQVPKNGQIFTMMMNHLGYSTDRINYAVRGCVQCGRCVTGCIYGAKQSMLVTYLLRAKSAGMEFIAETEALCIVPVSNGNEEKAEEESNSSNAPRYQVVCRRVSGEEFVISTNWLVLGAGTIGSARVLMQSKEHLPDLSSHVGRHISFNGSVKSAFLLPDWLPDGDMFSGRSHPGVMSFEFLESHGIVLTPAKPLPLQVFAAARISRYSDGQFGYWGKDHAKLMQNMRNRMMVIVAFGNLKPSGSLRLGTDGKLKFELKITEAERNFYRTATELIQNVVEPSGGELLNLKLMAKNGLPHEDIHFTSSHQLGSCRMSERPENGVVDAFGQVHGYPGLYITDGSILPSSLTIGPSLTILANAERLADKLLERMGRKRVEAIVG